MSFKLFFSFLIILVMGLGFVSFLSCVNAASLDKKVVMIIPHPDDETIGLGGTIQRLKSQGYKVHCVLLTSGNGITPRVPRCKNYYGAHIPKGVSLKERKKIIREDSFRRVMKIYGCSYEHLSIDDGAITQDGVYNIMEQKYYEGYRYFYTTTADYNMDHQNCAEAMRSMFRNHPDAKYRQVPIYWHATPKFRPIPLNYNHKDFNVGYFLNKKHRALAVYNHIDIFRKGLYKTRFERVYYVN